MSTQSEKNLAVLQAYFDAMTAGGPPAAMKYYSESVVLDVPGNHPASGHYEGHDGVGLFGKTMAGITGGTFRLSPIDLLASDTRVVTYARATATVGDRSAEWLRVIVSETDGETLTRLRFFEEDQTVVDDLLGGAAE